VRPFIDFRGDSAAASLKPGEIGVIQADVADFRGDSAAASLKPHMHAKLSCSLLWISAAIPPRPH